MRIGFRVAASLTGVSWLMAVVALSSQLPLSPARFRNHPAIAYGTTPSTDPVARLNDRLKRGETTLAFEADGTGYLRAVLRALDVPVESQALVFSKTSFQAMRIGPQNPRALFFGDTVAVGFVRGSDLLEFVGQDPDQGAMFYTLRQTPGGTPQFERNVACIQCHSFEGTHDVPGMFIGSVYPAADGTAMYGPTFTTDHRSLFERRWGGWYVTGTHQAASHMGNALATDPTDLTAMITPHTVHVTSLEGRFDPAQYPSRFSDVVALLVLEHQTQMLNLITRVGWEARIGADAGRPLQAAAAELVDYMLFVDESPLPGRVVGSTSFASLFAARGPADRQGRSLREFDLETRIFRYPCSYLIYSEPFDHLPADAKAAVYARLWQILSGIDTAPRYARLTAADRTAIVEILRETKPGLPQFFTDTVLE